MFNKFLALLLICGLNFSLLKATDEKENLDQINILLLQLTANGNTITTNCNTPDLKCLLSFLKGNNESDTETEKRTFFLNSFHNRHRTVINVPTDKEANGTRNFEYFSPENFSHSTEDFSSCGTYPACSITRLSGYLWSFTCDRALVSFAVAMGIILCIIIIISNLVIIVVTLRTKTLRKPHGYFKLSLAAADCLAGILVLPSILHFTLTKIDYNTHIYTSENFIDVVQGVDETYSAAGSFFGVVGVLTTITGVYSLLLLSIDSFLSVRWPLEYRIGDLITTRRAVSAILFIWAVALAVSFLPLLAKNYISYGLVFYTYQYIPIIQPVPGSTTSDSIGYRFSHAIVYAVFVWVVPFVVTWVLTVLTSIQSRKMLKNMREARRRSVRSAKALNKVDRELVRTVAIVLTIFTLTILPIAIVMFTLLFHKPNQCYSNVTSIAFFITTYIFICGRFLNVVVYNVFNKDFREACRNLFVSIVHFIFCYDEMEEELAKTSVSEKKQSSFWSTNKTKSKRGTKETGLTVNTASTSVDHKGLLSPGLTTTSKLSVSSATDVANSPNGKDDRNNSVFTMNESN